MAKAAARQQIREKDATVAPELARDQGVVHGPAFGRVNFVLMGVALAVIVAGFIALGQGSITLAPILLVTGYLALVPLALLKR